MFFCARVYIYEKVQIGFLGSISNFQSCMILAFYQTGGLVSAKKGKMMRNETKAKRRFILLLVILVFIISTFYKYHSFRS